MIKFKIFKDVRKEEIWLNSMAILGFKLKYYSENYCFYIFEKGEKENLEYKCDFRFVEGHDIMRYRQLFEEFNWAYIKHNINGGKHIFYRNKNLDSKENELFQDIELIEEQRSYRLKRNISYTLMCLLATSASVVCKVFYLNNRSIYIHMMFNIFILMFIVYFCMNMLKTILSFKKV